MTDPADERSAPTRSKPRRARRFVLPDGHHDERTAAGIVAFLDGRDPRGRRAGGAWANSDRPRLPKALDTRPDWTTAFQHESARHARYGRPVSVLLLELADGTAGRSLDRVASALAELIRAEARETDRAVRVGPSSFRLLMPETGGRAARNVGARLDRVFHGGDPAPPGGSGLRVEIAAPTRGGSLEDALTDAERRLGS